jgi:hypothetical protein
LKSLVRSDPAFTFVEVTLFAFSCFAPTEFFGSLRAA